MEDLSSLFSFQEPGPTIHPSLPVPVPVPSADELKQRLLYMTYELQSAKMQAQEEAQKNRDATETTKQLLNLLQVAYKERDEAREQLKKLNSPSSGITESNSHSSESLYDVVSPITGVSAESAFVQIDPGSRAIHKIAEGRPLPAKGRLLEAVMGAGPLLQTLMVAGPLPRWRNPPPMRPLQAGFDGDNQGGGTHLVKRPFSSAVPCGSSRFLNNSVLNFSGSGELQGSATMGFSDSGVGLGFGFGAPKRRRIQ